MEAKKIKHPTISLSENVLLKQPFNELINQTQWSSQMSQFYKRVNEAKDERSFILLLALIIEFHIDNAIKAFFQNPNTLLTNKDLTLSVKTEIIKSLKLIPNSIFNFIDIVRLIRNEFAHNINLDTIEQLGTYTKGKKLITKLYSYCNEYEEFLVYSKHDKDNLRDKFKDIANFAINGLREYEPSIQLIKNEMFKKQFIDKIIGDNNFKILNVEYLE